MIKAEIISIGGHQAVKLPDEYRFPDAEVSIRREGRAVILEAAPATTWPAGFFEAIRIDDPALARPPQGQTPDVPSADAWRGSCSSS